MANALTLSALTEIIFKARDVVANEPTGYLQGCTINTAKDGVSINGTVQSFVTPAATVNSSATPAMTVPAPDAYTIAAKTMTIGQTARVAIPINGEDWLKLQNTSGYDRVMQDMFAQSMRGIRNAIEAHCASIAQLGASRATGTAGTAPFATTINNISDVRQILLDNGSPMDGNLTLALNTTAGTKLRQVPNLYKANEAGNDILLRRGELLNLEGFSIRETAQSVTVAAIGTGTNYVLNGSHVKGATTLTVKDGSGTIVAGDVVTIGNYKYVVATALSSVTLVIAEPGLMAAQTTGDTVTVNAIYTANTAFHRSAIELVMRPPALPPGGDIAIERMTVQDDRGLVYEIAVYKGYLMNTYEMVTYYQAKAWNTKYIATLLG
jgi:hypothetical protein